MGSYNEEEKALIEEAYAELHANDEPTPAPMMGEGHEECDAKHEEAGHKIIALATVIEALVIKVGQLDESIERVAHTVDVDLIESARKVAQATGHKMKVGEVMTKYHDKFKDYEEPYKSADWGEEGAPDIYEQLTDILDEIKISPEYVEGKDDEVVEGLLGQFKTAFPQVGQPVAPEVAPGAELSDDEKARQNAIDYVRRFKEGVAKAKKG
jgi:hypothetical protein